MRDETGTAGTAEDVGERVTLTEEDIGKPIVDHEGDKIAMVSGVDEEANALFVDVQPGLTERIRAALGWGDVDEEDYRLTEAEISRVTDDAVELRDPETIDERR